MLRTPNITTRAFTCIELLVFIILVACISVGTVKMLQFVPGFWGGILGAITGIAVFFLGLMAVVGLLDLIYGGIPRFPRCSQGTCRGLKDYEFKRFGEQYNAVCRHGDRYVRRERRFMSVTEDGTETPYLIWRPFAGWHEDTSSP